MSKTHDYLVRWYDSIVEQTVNVRVHTRGVHEAGIQAVSEYYWEQLAMDPEDADWTGVEVSVYVLAEGRMDVLHSETRP